LRVPGDSLILSTLRLMVGPVVLTSANRAGQPEAVTADEIIAGLGSDIDLILDGGRCRYAQPSTVVQVNGNELKTLRAGVLDEPTMNRLTDFTVVLVCTGNTCRSPMAEGLLKKRFADQLGVSVEQLADAHVSIVSAGVAAFPGNMASQESVEVMEERGIDIGQHESQPLTERLVRYADIILTMTRGHLEAVVSQWPDAANRTFLLSGSRADVSDPIGGPIEVYRDCAKQIDQYLAQWMPKFESLQGKLPPS
jgi:protein-tyrosine-phosphatase